MVKWPEVCVSDQLKTSNFIIGEWKPEAKSKYSRLATIADAIATQSIWRKGWHVLGIAGIDGYKTTGSQYGYKYKAEDTWKSNGKPLCNHKWISDLLVCLAC